MGKLSGCFKPCMDKKLHKKLMGKRVRVLGRIYSIEDGRVIGTSIYGSALIQYQLGKIKYTTVVAWKDLEMI